MTTLDFLISKENKKTAKKRDSKTTNMTVRSFIYEKNTYAVLNKASPATSCSKTHLEA